MKFPRSHLRGCGSVFSISALCSLIILCPSQGCSHCAWTLWGGWAWLRQWQRFSKKHFVGLSNKSNSCVLLWPLLSGLCECAASSLASATHTKRRTTQKIVWSPTQTPRTASAPCACVCVCLSVCRGNYDVSSSCQSRPRLKSRFKSVMWSAERV